VLVDINLPRQPGQHCRRGFLSRPSLSFLFVLPLVLSLFLLSCNATLWRESLLASYTPRLAQLLVRLTLSVVERVDDVLAAHLFIGWLHMIKCLRRRRV
jgi:hypothetical protein